MSRIVPGAVGNICSLSHNTAMRTVEYTIGNNESRLIGYIHDDLSSYCDTYRKRPAVIICPGGGYVHLSPREADPVAFQFLSAGYQVFILYYSIGEAIRKVSPESEAAAAIKLVRENSEDLDVEENMIAIAGFSAGGHLALSIACHWRLYGEESKPDAAVLSYPVVTMGEYAHAGSREALTDNDEKLISYYSLETQVSDDTPPCFIWHTAEDMSVPVMNSILLSSALSAVSVPFELHIFQNGAHGLSIARKETGMVEKRAEEWVQLSISWLSSLFGFSF